MQPALSICVPTFNREGMLRRNLSFHLEQFRALGLSFEIVVVDDCSTDGTSAYLAGVAHEPELKVFRRTSNSGFLSNYAFAMRRATGRYAVFLGDDDLLIPEKVAEYVARLDADPHLGMIQAPWLCVDERPGAGAPGPFYRIPGESRFARGAFQAAAQFLFDFHVFPEFMIVRRDVLARSISAACPFIFWAFLFTGRALAHADVLFTPQPFARVTAASADPREQQGYRETMFQWDHYRGGIEYFVSLGSGANTLPLEGGTPPPTRSTGSC
jgi:glycosyltransferase involved in cell wall biosynthesis